MKRWLLPAAALALGVGLGSYFVGSHLHGQNVEPLPKSAPSAAIAKADPGSYRDIVKKILPAVVSIDSKTKAGKAAAMPPQLPENMPEEWRRFFEEFQRNPENRGELRIGFGSGFFVDANGVVVTNAHVVNGADYVIVHTQDGRKFNSKEIRIDRRTDLAVIKLDLKGAKVPYLEFGDSTAMEIGDHVLAVGAPFGLTGSVTHGIISAKGRNGLNMNMYEDFLQTDAAVNPGNSGGPLVNLAGQAVGINSAIKSQSGGFQGIGLAVASNLARNVVKSLLTDGVVHRAYLGIQVRDLVPDVAARLGVPKDTGVLVAEVFERTPAAKAGIQPGDVLISVGGKAIKDRWTLQSTIAGLPVGKPTDVVIFRDGKSRTLPVTLEEQPTDLSQTSNAAPRFARPDQDPVALGKIGVDVIDLDDAQAESLGFRKGTHGALVTRVSPTGPAADTELRAGTVIVKIDGRGVENAANAQKELKAASVTRGILLQVLFPQGGTSFVLIKSDRE